MAVDEQNNNESSLVNSAIGAVIRLDRFETLLAEAKISGNWETGLKILDCEFDFFAGLMLDLKKDGTVEQLPEFKICEDLRVNAHKLYNESFQFNREGIKQFNPSSRFLESFRSYEVYLKLISRRHNIGYNMEINTNSLNPLLRPAQLQRNIRGRF